MAELKARVKRVVVPPLLRIIELRHARRYRALSDLEERLADLAQEGPFRIDELAWRALERLAAGEVPEWAYPAAFLVLGVAHSGIRLGRKTYLVDMAGGNKRTDYVAVSNTVIGVILLAAGGIMAALSFLQPETLILLLAATSLAGALAGLGLPEVED